MKVDNSSPAADRNLLFGVLAVQMDFVSGDELIAGMNSWVLDKARPLGSHLIDRGALDADTHALIQALVEKHIQQHGGRVEQSLAAISSAEPLRRELASIADADVQTSLARAGSPTPRGDRHATVAMPAARPQPDGERYRVLRPHAAGGLGKVSVARDNELNREVALKELHDRHADSPESRARFLQEAEITGGLEHPGIVPIYGLGQYADGRPFYAMRFIRGDSLAQAIDRFHRDADPHWSNAADVIQLRRLLARFLDVCNAMEYAHSRGVLHRDLKPGNIMLGQYGETLVVDWGLAKPLGKTSGESMSASADATIPHQSEPALTPQSGSGSAPTQMGSAIGTPAFMSPEQAAGRLDQLGPTSDVYSLGAVLYTLLTGRPSQDDDDLGVVLQRVQRGDFPPPRAVKPVIPRGLEAICLKAMALHPNDRYPTARQLADDVEAWLADEPITARPESIAGRTFRWVKNHRTLVTSGAAMVLVALVALSAGNVRLRAANDRERDSKNAALLAQKRAQASQLEAERQAARNEELLVLARKSLDQYDKLSQSELLRSYGMESLRRDLLEAALEFYATLARQAGESEAARAERGSALQRLGSAYWQLGRMDQARAAFDEALAIFQKLEAEVPSNPAYPRGAALALAAVGELLNGAREAVAAASPLADARKRLESLHRSNAADIDVTMRLAYLHALEGERLRQLGKMEEAADLYAQGIALLESIDLKKVDSSISLDLRYRLARAISQLATLESQALWRFKPAREHFDRAAGLMRTLYQEHPDVGDYGFSLAQLLRNTGFLYARENYYDDARNNYDQALEVIRDVNTRWSNVPHYHQELAEMLHASGSLHRPLEKANTRPEALAQLEQAVAIGSQLVEQYPQQVDRRLALARYQSTLGGVYLLKGRSEDAAKSFDTATALLTEVSQRAGDSVDTLYTLGQMRYAIAQQLAQSKRTLEALDMLDQSEQNLAKLVELAPRYGESYLSLGNVYIERSNCLDAVGRLTDAVAELDRVAAIVAKTAEVGQVPWMQSGLQAVGGLARTIRWGHLKRIRSGALNHLADVGQYDVAADQARLLPEVTHETSDCYIAAKTLAYAAQVAEKDQKLTEDKRTSVVEPLAAEAVKQLTAAWEKGYLRRNSGGLSSLFSSTPTLQDVQTAGDFTVVRDREDFRQLVERIRSESPPKSTAPTKENAPATGASK